MKVKERFIINSAMICIVLFTIVTAITIVGLADKNNEVTYGEPPLGLNEIISGTIKTEVNDESIDSISDVSRTAVLYSRKLENNAESELNKPEIERLNSADILASDLDNLRNKDEETVIRYFGNSSSFSPEIVADKLAATKATIVSEEIIDESTIKCIIHICTLDYYGMKEASSNMQNEIQAENTEAENVEDTVKKEIAKKVVTGDFLLHYTIPVEIVDNKLVVTEEFKQAITGGWYKGLNTELKPVDCPL